ncbi:MAG: DNA mismatch repair protein MutS, partial [Thermomicrobiales bacterium]
MKASAVVTGFSTPLPVETAGEPAAAGDALPAAEELTVLLAALLVVAAPPAALVVAAALVLAALVVAAALLLAEDVLLLVAACVVAVGFELPHAASNHDAAPAAVPTRTVRRVTFMLMFRPLPLLVCLAARIAPPQADHVVGLPPFAHARFAAFHCHKSRSDWRIVQGELQPGIWSASCVPALTYIPPRGTIAPAMNDEAPPAKPASEGQAVMVTPARRQYLALKEQHPDTILFFQIGDFYETFDDDAKVVARDAEVHLTSKDFGRAGRVPLAGVPVRAIDAYLRKLLAKGHRVAVCDQVSEAGHGLVERAIVRVVTPGTLIEPQLLRERENTYLAAVAHGKSETALAYVDVSTGEFAVTMLAGPEREAALAAELGRLAPAEVLAPAGQADLPGGWHVAPRARADFAPEDAADRLCAHFGVRSLEGYGCADLPLACGAAAAILAYLREYNPRLLAGLRGLHTYDTSAFMVLDAQTRRNLELVRGGRGPRGGRGLLGVLDATRTAPGGRLLRRWLSQPLLDPSALAARHDAGEEFLAQPAMRGEGRVILGQLGDLERLTGRMTAGTVGPRELHALRASLGQIAPLAESRAAATAPLTARCRDALDPCSDVADLIERAVAGAHEGRRIRPGFDAELDALVDGARDARRWIADLERRERERTKIRSLKVGYNKVFGYYLEVTKPNLAHVPADYLRKQTLSHCERFITPELKECEARINDAESRIAALEDAIYARLLDDLAVSAPRLLAVAAASAQLDVLAAFAEVADQRGYTRPALDTSTALHIRAGRHPTVEAALEQHAFIPNDLDL